MALFQATKKSPAPFIAIAGTVCASLVVVLTRNSLPSEPVPTSKRRAKMPLVPPSAPCASSQATTKLPRSSMATAAFHCVPKVVALTRVSAPTVLPAAL